MHVRLFIALSGMAALIALTGCDIGLPGSGVSVDESREVEDFTGVRLRGIGDVVVTIGEEKSVTITTDDNLIEFIETKVEEGVLSIGSSRSISPKVGLRISITTLALDQASVSGVGNLNIMGATGDSLSVSVSGVGDIEASGSIRDLTVEVSGVGDANLKGLTAENVNVQVSGTGDAEVFASKSVNAQVSGVGGIQIYGNPPEVSKSESGVGSVSVHK